MPKIKIICPSCKKNGFIEVSDDVLKNVSRGLLAINMATGTICSDSFIAYIDKAFNVRDYFVADFHIEIPDLPISPVDKLKIPSQDVVDIDLIKLNLPAMMLSYVIKSIFSKQKIILISEQEFLYNHIHNFLNYITQGAFDIDISIMKTEEYNNNKKQYKDAMVFEGNIILKNAKKIINPKKMWIEKQIVSRFLTETELDYSYIILKNEIQKAYKLSKVIVDFVKESKEKKESVNTLKINTQLEKLYGIKINIIYLKFLIEIVENYFGVTVPSIISSFLEI